MKNKFCGWYLKFQNEAQTIALIPAYHSTGGRRSCSIQIITDDGSWNVTFPYSEFQRCNFWVNIAENYFGEDEVRIDLHAPELTAVGHLTFGPFSPIRYDIMGPFGYIPFMQCRHSIFSMRHSVNGYMEINGVSYHFSDGAGYIEGDLGRSFPKNYVWTHCFFPDGSLMLSVADIPFCGFHFIGVIGVVHYRGKEFRLGTYLGARVQKLCNGEVIIKQGGKTLTVKLLEKKGHPLAAPVGGSMCRTIHETAACRASYCFQEAGKTLFSFVSEYASFEYEYPQ